MKYTITIAVVAGLVLALAPAAWADGTPSPNPKAPTPPPGGYPDAYRLMFVTETGWDSIAGQTDINWYNTQVNNAANNLGGETGSTVAGLATWKCVGSTATVDAKVNTKTNTVGDEWDVPIYNFAGELLSPTSADMWDGALHCATDTPGYDSNGIFDEWSFETGVELGAMIPATKGDSYQSVWTGTGTSGTAWAGMELGATLVKVARAERLWSGDWIAWGSGIASDGSDDRWVGQRLYALSDPIPEPVTMSLLALGGLGVLIRRKRA